MYLNFIVIPFITIIVAVSGSFYTSKGMIWYRTEVKKPSWTPPGSAIGIVWTVLYFLATIAVLGVWNTFERGPLFTSIITVFLLNALLNFFWSYLFFGKHKIMYAIYECAALALTVLLLIILTWPFSLIVALLLIPYFIWVSFATYLTYSVWVLN